MQSGYGEALSSPFLSDPDRSARIGRRRYGRLLFIRPAVATGPLGNDDCTSHEGDPLTYPGGGAVKTAAQDVTHPVFYLLRIRHTLCALSIFYAFGLELSRENRKLCSDFKPLLRLDRLHGQRIIRVDANRRSDAIALHTMSSADISVLS